MKVKTNTLAERWKALLEESPKLRIRNAAEELGVTEVELLATRVSSGVIRLRADFKEILAGIENLGYVMALTRNNDVVHERKGVYLNGSFGPHASMFVGEDIDLRMFLNTWGSAFAVEEETDRSMRRSLQFFGKDGEAIHKIYLTPKSNVEAFWALIDVLTSEDQSTEQSVEAMSTPEEPVPDHEIDVAGFKEAWLNMKDTHDFFGMTLKFNVTRVQAVRFAPDKKHAVRMQNNTHRKVFEGAAAQEVPIMVFVGNKGMIQIHTGPVKKLVDHGTWFNVLDPKFNLHLNESSIAETWIVRKPTRDGIVTSLELFNAQNELIATLFGKRKPGIPELEAWRAVIASAETHFQYNVPQPQLN
jgi:putative hemin transport protein